MIYRSTFLLFLSFSISLNSYAATVLDDLKELYNLHKLATAKHVTMSVINGVVIPIEICVPIVGWIVAGFTHPGSRSLHRARTAGHCMDSNSNLEKAIDFLETAEKAYQKMTYYGEKSLDQTHYSSKFRRHVSQINDGHHTFEQVIEKIHAENQTGMGGLMVHHPVTLQQEQFQTNIDSGVGYYQYYYAPNYLKLIKEYMVNQLRAERDQQSSQLVAPIGKN